MCLIPGRIGKCAGYIDQHLCLLRYANSVFMFLYCSVPGPPQLYVSMGDVEFLRGMRFSWTKIAEILGISRSTLYRRLEQDGIDRRLSYSEISDIELDEVMVTIKLNHPNDGERMIIGHLHRLGVVLPRARIRASIHRVDPVNTALRRSITIRRRVYHVRGPNSLWHIDGHHKLIRWRMVLHGGIDGFSRTVVYLRCSTNNQATTVIASFIDAVSKYGLPEQVRSDHGGENIEVWKYMLQQHQSSSAVLVGASTHNERIERLWRDVHRCVSVLFADLFRHMETAGILDCLNEVDMFCLHTAFLPRINHALDSFVESWNNHPLSTAENLTPNQLFIQGALKNMAPMFPNPIQSGNSVEAPLPRDSVAVPRSTFTACEMLNSELDQHDMLTPTDDFGYSLYQNITNLVGTHLQHCTECIN